MKAPSEETYVKSTQEHNVDLKSTSSG